MCENGQDTIIEQKSNNQRCGKAVQNKGDLEDDCVCQPSNYGKNPQLKKQSITRNIKRPFTGAS